MEHDDFILLLMGFILNKAKQATGIMQMPILEPDPDSWVRLMQKCSPSVGQLLTALEVNQMEQQQTTNSHCRATASKKQVCAAITSISFTAPVLYD